MGGEAVTPDRLCHCSKCNGPRDRPNDRYCRDCRRKYWRAWKARERRDAKRYRAMKLANPEDSFTPNN